MTMDEKRIARLFGLSFGGLFAIGLILSAITI
jgi:predicted alpha/beta superfamily hydrolase